MRPCTFIIIIIFTSVSLLAQSPYNSRHQAMLNFAVKIFPIVGPEFDREKQPLVPYDYIHDSYKRQMSGNGFEWHIDTPIGGVFNRDYSSFQMPHTYLNISKSFFSFWYLSITPFATVSSDYNSFDNGENNNFNFNMYDAGIQIIGMSHILFEGRLRALNDFSSTSFMLNDYLVNTDNSTFYDSSSTLKRLNNGAGIRVGLIGNYYELSFSQSYLGESNNPFTILARVKLDSLSVQALYGYAKKSFYSVYDNIENSNNNHIFQLSANIKTPLPLVMKNSAVFFNALAEYTFINNDANYIRLEEGLEWRIFNLAFREIIYLPKEKNDEPNFIFEYALYVKYNPLTVGFQGSTDGQYYILTKVIF